MTKRFKEVKDIPLNVPLEQMQRMATRFELLPERSAQRAAKLNYLEHKVKLFSIFQFCPNLFVFKLILWLKSFPFYD